MRLSLPDKGRSRDQLLAELRAMKSGDVDWKGGRAPLYVFEASDDIARLGRDAFFTYFTENALGARRAFPSVKRMEDEVVQMALSLFRAPEAAAGFMTSGGTESIVLAVQACRDWHRRRHRPTGGENIVLPYSAHPAFDKAARLMDLEVRRVPVGPDFRADPVAMAERIDERTLMIVGSAPCFPFGVVDPIRELGILAERQGVWLHVDACVGGYLGPFVRRAGWPVTDFEFCVPQVASMSADLHKFGFCPKPASTLLFRDPDRAACAAFEFDDWPNGRFATNTLVGTRPAGGVAAAWTVFNHLGLDGYTEVARRLMTFVDGYIAMIASIEGLYVHGRPEMSIVNVGSDSIDVFAVAEHMQGAGWLPGLTRTPRGLHRMMSFLHADSADAFEADLRAAVKAVRGTARGPVAVQAQY